MAAFIGPRWESYYRRKLARFSDDPSFTPTWNWAAALGCPFWFLYRKLFFAFVAFSIIPGYAFAALSKPDQATAQLFQSLKNASPEEQSKVFEHPEVLALVYLFVGISLSTIIAAGGTANWLLYRRARAAAIIVSVQQMPEDAAITWLRKNGGVTLLPAVLVVIAMILIPILASK